MTYWTEPPSRSRDGAYVASGTLKRMHPRRKDKHVYQCSCQWWHIGTDRK